MARSTKTIMAWGLAGAIGAAAIGHSMTGHGTVERATATTASNASPARPISQENGVDNPFGNGAATVPEPAAAEATRTETPRTSRPVAIPAPTTDPRRADGAAFTCERKTCRQMSSCEEAKYHLNVCADAHLDGNHDGVPCESLCR